MPVADRPDSLRLHARPALVIAAALTVGVVLETRAQAGIAAWAFALSVAATIPVAVAVVMRRRLVTPVPIARALAGCIAVVAVGGARMAVWDRAPRDDVSHVVAAAALADTMDGSLDVVLRGYVAEPPVVVGGGTRVRVAAASLLRGTREVSMRGLVEVTLARRRFGDQPPPTYPILELGDEVELAGLLRAPPGRRNPADFDYGAHLRRLGVGATMRIVDEEGAVRLGPTRNPVTSIVAAVQVHTRRAIQRHVRGEDARAILLALLIADRSGIDPDTRSSFAQTGLTHLLAVSGLHILLVGLVLYNLLRPTLVRLRLGWRAVEATRAAITLGILGVYALVTGGSPSVVRAVVMAGAMVAARTLQRPTDALNGLGLAALGLILWRPTALYDVGFQLSYAAVGALVLLSPVFLAAFPERAVGPAWARAGAGMLVASLAATLGTAPVLLYHFGQVPLGGVILNLPAIPVANVALGAGLGLALAAGPAPWAADALAAVAELATSALLAVNAAGAAGLEWTIVHGFVTRPPTLIAMVCGLLAIASWRAPAPRWRLLVAALVCSTAGVGTAVAAGDASPKLDAVFLDVGQGDATLLSLPGPRHVLIDAGPRDDDWDAGARTVVPHLRRHGIDELEIVVITHPHADHFGGVEAVLRAVDVRRIIVNGAESDHPLLLRTLAVADSLGVPVVVAHTGDTLDLGPAVRARILSPALPPPPSDDGSEINDGSVVIRVQYGATSLLLTGDAEAHAESQIASRYGDALRSDVVKVGHHGSRTSSTPAFVAQSARPGTWAVVQVARRNRYGLPDDEPLARWVSAGARVVLTGSEGAVWLRSDGRHFQRVHWRN